MIKNRLKFTVALLSFLLLPILNTLAQEKQVAFFPDQNILTISKSYAKKMSFFTDYKGFVEAKLFETGDKYALEIYYLVNDSIYKDRKLLTAAEKDSYIDSLLKKYAEENQIVTTGQESEVRALNQKGRSALLITSTLTGLGYYGYALPISFNVEEVKGFVALYMLSSSASFFFPYMATKFQDVTLAQASLSFYGQSRGIMHGIFLGNILAKDVNYDDYNHSTFYGDEEYYDDLDRRNRVLFGMGIIGSVAGGISGFKLADRWDYNGGSTSIMQMWGDAGTIGGFLLADIFDFYDGNSSDAVFTTALLSTSAGLVTGKLFADTRNYTLGDAIVYRSILSLGCLAPVTLVHYFEPNDGTAYTAAAFTGGLAAGFGGWWMLRDKNFKTGDGILTALGEISGGLLGLGLGFLIAPEDNDGKLILTTATAGALAGFGLMYNRHNQAGSISGGDLKLEMNLNPLAILMSQQSNITPYMATNNYLGTIRLRF